MKFFCLLLLACGVKSRPIPYKGDVPDYLENFMEKKDK